MTFVTLFIWFQIPYPSSFVGLFLMIRDCKFYFLLLIAYMYKKTDIKGDLFFTNYTKLLFFSRKMAK